MILKDAYKLNAVTISRDMHTKTTVVLHVMQTC